MKEYIEFIHDQSNWTSGATFDINIINNTIMQTEILASFFEYTGWYKYIRYDENKLNIISEGKLLVKDDKEVINYDNKDDEKIIYNE